MQISMGMSVLHSRKVSVKIAKYQPILLAVSFALFFFLADFDLASAFDFHSESGSFSVTLPTNPILNKRPMKHRGVELLIYSYEAVSIYSMMAVSYFDLPNYGRKPDSEIEARDLLSSMLNGALEYNNAVLIEKKDSFHQNYPSLDFYYDDVNREVYLRGRFIVAGERVYQLQVAYPKGFQFPSSGSTLLKSFRIW